MLLRIPLSRRESLEGLTDHVDGGSSGPRPMMLLDGVVESGLTQLNGSHTDPEAQAEQPGHDRTHLLRTGSGTQNTSCSQPMTSTHASAHTLGVMRKINEKIQRNTFQDFVQALQSIIGLNAPRWSLLVIGIYH